MLDVTPYSLTGKRVWVAGATGMLGSAICRGLKKENCNVIVASRRDLNLCRQADVEAWMSEYAPQVVFFAAGTVGGIHANETRPGEFIYENSLMAMNVINSAYLCKVEKLLMLGSSCIYPRLAKQPIAEEKLLTGPLESTNEYYAIAKIAGVKLCEAFRSQYNCDFINAIPANLYGPGDTFDSNRGHVIPGLIERLDFAKKNGGPVTIWGTGKPQREFMHVDDAADAIIFLMKNYSNKAIINIGTGDVYSISELAKILSEIIGYHGSLKFDTSKPDGMPRKQLDVSRLVELGWISKRPFREGLQDTYNWYRKEVRT